MPPVLRSTSFAARGRAPANGRNAAGNMLIGVFIGVVIGLGVAALVAYFVIKSPSPFQSPPSRSPIANGGAAKAEGPTKAASVQAADKPRFDFYKILPGTEEGKQAPPAAAARQPAVIATNIGSPQDPRGTEGKAGESLFLQAGAFQNQSEAEVQKAKLALLGMEASIQRVIFPDKGVWYRVRLGPYRSPDEMSRNRAQLAKSGVDATVIKNQ
jgi:cell division protein FtsN